uniref:Uncharacterized protein n=1 Tax=Phaseolus vulgaris TaxID=3885 RepID=V7BSA0_PHAVU|nr:hypothetical protein PHAVU_006G166300g [Phaseolus vulgaris]ESW19920.1 hypothetical protein PHAVU_006G166300g [Phaseolus vulgaris]
MESAKMVGLKRLIRRRSSLRDYVVGSVAEKDHRHCPLHSQHLARLTPKRFLDLHQFVNKKAIAEERARIGDEMKRGYFADMAEFKQHGGKIGLASKVIIPAMVAVKFPDFEVSFSDGKTVKLPIRVSDFAVDSDKSSVPKASLVCLSFRANSQEMINSWSVPFLEAFRKSKGVHLYQYNGEGWSGAEQPLAIISYLYQSFSCIRGCGCYCRSRKSWPSWSLWLIGKFSSLPLNKLFGISVFI